MSTRTTIIADPAGKAKEVAEGLSGLPLVWIPMLSSEDLANLADLPQATITRKDGVDRISAALPFLQEQFPDLEELAETAEELLGHLKKSRAKDLAIDLTDPVSMDTKSFLGGLRVAVSAIESRDPKGSFKAGRCKYKSTREVLCYLSTLDPDNGLAEKEQMIGELW